MSETPARPHHPHVVVAFDFDQTLSTRTTDHLVRHLGVDPDEFERNAVAPRVAAGWDTRLAEAAALLELSRTSEHGPVTRSTFDELGATLELYPGVADLFEILRDAVGEISTDLSVEFHLITAGFVEMPSATPIASEFTSIRGGHWAFDDDGALNDGALNDGALCFPASTLGHDAKVRHLEALAKGLDTIDDDASPDLRAPLPLAEWHAPWEQVIYVADGNSDLPAFEFVRRHGGTAIGVHQAPTDAEWDAADAMRPGRRVDALHRSDYRDGRPLLDTMIDAVTRAALHARITARSTH
ncbi:MAG: hypothetical protein ACRBI6_11120 [Acidimicrobiales bacterium]